ncbi:hypothetical protein [Sinanaerobacter chloroacetimidivorans]|uniref:Uncharacterized protein n=1 Tax=Sinanaerobacter chloroacetimidivorans TaxID=2818044 RepID=A0A8J8B0B9_9FIRM|nr:hypothetical protein [Sinanaerobacter chloroacetimidivorans]MBR0597024.1 hypothetical protein [Sinanaerobacter chloroacetimidivorans]
MLSYCASSQFQHNDRVVSLVYHHPPEIMPGTKGTILTPRIGSLYTVQLPDGELHRWFSGSELEPDRSLKYTDRILCPGSMARIITSEGHPQHIFPGMTVRIIKVIDPVIFYDLMIDGYGYHRWLADFEIASLDLVSAV